MRAIYSENITAPVGTVERRRQRARACLQGLYQNDEWRNRYRQRKRANEKRLRTTPMGWLRRALRDARDRAKRKNLEFTATMGGMFVPTSCPVFGVPFQFGGGYSKWNASLDRIDNTKGYTNDNVIVVSRFANSVKSYAVWQEIMKVAEFYRDLESKRSSVAHAA